MARKKRGSSVYLLLLIVYIIFKIFKFIICFIYVTSVYSVNYLINNPILILLIVEILTLIYLLNYNHLKKKAYEEIQRKKELFRENITLDGLRDKFKEKPTDFEKYIAVMYECLGYTIEEVTKPVSDCGKDIIMYKGNLKYVVEVKLYKETSSISRDKIQKLHSAMITSEADKAIFVTTSKFTKPSKEYANISGITLVNGSKLNELIGLASEEETSKASTLLKLS